MFFENCFYLLRTIDLICRRNYKVMLKFIKRLVISRVFPSYAILYQVKLINIKDLTLGEKQI